MKRLIAIILAALVVASVMAACGGNSGSGSGSGSDSGSGSKASAITVNIWDSNQQKGIQEICDKWTETSGVKVNVEVVDWDNYWTLLEAGASGGTMPDVFWMHSNTAQMYMENDILLDLTDYVSKDSSIDLSKYYEGVKNLYTRSDGKIFALPKDHDTIALLYNKAIFDKYGVDYPTDNWTWENMYEAAKKITEGSNGEVYGMAMNTSNNQDGWYNLIYSYGGNVVGEDHKSTKIGSDEAKAGMEMMRKLLTVGAPQSVVAETGTDSLFQSGKVGMITQGSWMINAFYTAENHADYYWSLLPYADVNGNGTCEKEERWSAYNGLGWAASAKVKDPESCYSLIAYLCGEEGQKLQSEKGVTIKAEEFSLYFRPYTRNTTVWEDALQQKGAFLDPWQNPEDPALMSTACDNAQKIIEDAIAKE